MKIIIFIIICLNYIFTFGQQIDTVLVNASLKPYKFISTIDTFNVHKYLKGYILKVSIYSLEYNDFIQEIIDTADESFSITDISYCDINLDSYKDIKVGYDYSGMGGNSFWLFDPVIKHFKYSKDFDQIRDTYSIENEKEKIIRTYEPWYLGIVCATEYKYKIEGFKLILLEENGCYRYGSNNDNSVSYTKKLINNKFRTVSLDSIIHTNNNY